MKEKLLKIGHFLHLIDYDEAIDLTNIAFMIIMGKIIVATSLDWPSVVTLATVILNKVHKRRIDSSTPDEEDEKQLANQIEEHKKQIANITAKIGPIIEKVQGIIE